MRLGNVLLGLASCAVLGLLSACAGTEEISAKAILSGELTDASIDVLFATEFPVESEAEALVRARKAVEQGEIDKGLFYMVRALQFRPDNVELLVQIGEIQAQRQNTQFATRAFLMAKRHQPNHSGALEGLGLIYMSQGRDDEAAEHLSMAVANAENLWRAHNALGIFADKAGDYARAQRHYDLALAANSEASDVLNNRGYSKYLAGDVEGAKQDLYDAAHTLGFSYAWANLARIYAEEGAYREALTTYKLVMTEADAFNNAGSAALENGDYAKAQYFLAEAVRLSPTYFPSAVENLSLLQERQLIEASNVPLLGADR